MQDGWEIMLPVCTLDRGERALIWQGRTRSGLRWHFHSRETSVFRDEDLACFYGRLPWRVIAQVPNLCWERTFDTILRLVLLVGVISHCRKRNGVKICAASVTSIDTAQRQRRRSLLGTILRYS